MFRRTPTFVALACIASSAATPAAWGQASILTLDGAGLGAAYGTEVALVGDLDGDGVDDLFIGAPRSALGASAAEVVSGRTGDRIHLLVGLAPNSQMREFGFDAADAGDVDGDGAADVVIGAPAASAFDGRVFIVSGSDGSVLLELPGPLGEETEFGSAVAGLGDVDADGTPDIAVGAPAAIIGGISGKEVRVISGLTGMLLWSHASVHQIGSSLDALPDFDGDGVLDLLVGARSGPVRIHSGATGAVLREFPGVSAPNFFGSDCIHVGDLDGDGVVEIAVGDPLASLSGGASGGVRVYSGASSALLFSFDGRRASERAGTALCRAGDVDRDGLPDIGVGAPGFQAPFAGRVYLLSGLDGSTLRTVEAQGAGGMLGRSLAGPLTFDRDVYPDLVAGWPDIAAPRALIFSSVTFETHCSAPVNATGAAAHVDAFGTSSLSRDDLALVASPVPLGVGIFVASTERASIPLGNGRLCLGGTVHRFAPVATVGGTLTWSAGLSALPASIPSLAGSQVHFQAFFRDVLHGVQALGVSDGLTLTTES